MISGHRLRAPKGGWHLKKCSMTFNKMRNGKSDSLSFWFPDKDQQDAGEEDIGERYRVMRM